METTTEYKQSCLVNPDIPQTMPGTTLTNLPLEMLFAIFDHLTDFSDFANLTKVCKKFYYYINNNKWSVYSMKLKRLPRNWSDILSRFQVDHIYFNNLSKNDLLNALDFVANKKVTVCGNEFTHFYSRCEMNKNIFKKLGKIKEIEFSCALIDDQYYGLLQNCKSIKFINMYIINDTVFELNNLDLDSICFEDCRFTDDIDTLEFLKLRCIKDFNVINQ